MLVHEKTAYAPPSKVDAQVPRLNRICAMAEELHRVISGVETSVEVMCGGSKDGKSGSPVPVPDGLNGQIEQRLEGALSRLRVIEARLLAEA